MNVNYISLSTGRDTLLKNGIGDTVGSPPISRSKATKSSWLVMLLLFLSLAVGQMANAQSIVNYAFSSSTTGSLEDLSTGATTMLTGVQDDASTAVFPIGFDFWFMGVKYSHFSANSNGQFRFHNSATATAIGTNVSSLGAGAVTLAPMSGDNEVGNGMRFKVIGTAPNRTLVIEWNQFYINFVNITNAGNMQAWLSESNGKIDFVYGEIYNSATTSQTRSTFISSSNTATTAGSVTIAATPVWTTGTTLTVNTIAAGANPIGAPLVANLGSAAQGSRVVYTWTPTTAAPAAPTTLSFTAVTTSTTTVNWVDNSTTETGFAVTRALDAGFTTGVVITPVATTTSAGTGTAYSSVQTGLIPGTTYFYRVQAGVEGVGSAGLDGSQATTAGTTYYWVGVSGSTWGTAANWNTNPAGGGAIRSTPAASDILIVDGAGTTPGGSMIISHNVAGQIIGQLRVTSNTTLSLQSDTTTTRTTTIAGGPGDDLVVEAGSTLQLINGTNACALAFSGTGNTGLIAGTYNAAGSTSNVITTTGGTGTLVTVTGSVNNNILGSSGCMLGSTATLSFAAGSNYLHGSFTTTNGFIPLATWDTTSTVTITGGTTSTAITNPAQSFGNFVYNSTTSSGTMSVWTTGTTAVIKGNLTISATGTVSGIFRAVTTGLVTVNGNLNINGTSVFQVGNATATLNGIIVLGNTTIAAGASCNMNSAVFSQRGTTFTNNGTLTGTASASALNFFSPTNVAQTFTGTGTVLTNIGSLGVQNTSGLTISTTNPVTTLRVNLFNGTITGSNLITIGTGAALNTTVQIGYAGNTFAGGSFDVAPTWNLGTGTHGVIYAAEVGARTTGLEIPPSRILGALTSTNVNGVVVSGGNLSTGTLTFGTGTGNITTNASNVLTVTGTTVGSVVRTSLTAYVNGPLELTLPASLAATTYTWPIGKSALNTFALVNATTNAGGTVVVRAEAFDGDAGGTAGINIGAISTTKYWGATITSGGANFTGALIQLNDTTTGRDAIAGSATVSGAYDLQGGVTVTTTATTMTTTAPANTTLPGFFLMANKAAAAISNLAISPAGNQCANVARTVTVDVTPGGAAVTGVVINYSVNGVAQTPINMTATTSNGFPLLDSYTGTIPTVTPANATVTWSVTATDANTLVQTQSGVTYKDEPLFGMASATASTLAVCNGASTTLTAVLSAPGSASIGTQTTTLFDGVYRAGFGSGDYRHQLIYTAAELTAAGITAGNLTSIGFTITSLGSGAYNNYTISLGAASSTTAVSAFQTVPLTQVFTQASLTPVSGLNTYTFQTPYAWNGTSDILVNICYTVPVTGGTSTVGATTPPAARNSNILATVGACTAASGTTFANRPLATFGFNAAPAITSVSWSDGTSTVSTSNPFVASPTANTTYTATITAAGCTISPAGLAVVVNPIPNAPTQTVFDSTCGTNIPVVAVSDPNAISGALFRWYNAAGTTLLQSNVSATYLAAISTTTTFQVAVQNPVTGCESAKTTVVASVTSPTAIDPIANQTVCIGNSFSVTATAANDPVYVYTWTASPAAGSGIPTSLTGAAQTITPTVAGTYTYTVSATGGGCSTTTTFTATVNAFPVLSGATASPAAVCNNGISTLTATVPGALIFTASTGASLDPMTGAATVLGSNNDDDVTAAPVNIGFSFTFNGVAYTQYQASPDGWISLGATAATNNFSNSITSTSNVPRLAPLWDDLATGTTGNVTAVTTGTAPNRILKVQWFVTSPRATGGAANSTFQAWLYEGSNKIEYRYGTIGAPGSASAGYTIGATNFSSITFSSNTASTTTANNANANAPVSGTMYTYTLPVPGNITWSPLDDLYTNAAATIPYTGTNAAVVYSRPTVTRNYTASLTENGCTTNSGVVTVTQNGIAVADPTGPAAVCLGTPTIPAGPITYTSQVGATFTSSNPAVATIDAGTGVLTPLTAGTTNIIAQVVDTLTGCTSVATNTLAVTVSAPIAITTNPASQNILDGNPVSFTVAASGSVASYRWQESPSGASGTFVDIVNGDPLYTGQATNTLSIASATITPYNGLYYRCVVTGVAPCASPVESDGALLTVSDLSTTDPTFTTPICGTGNHTFTTVSTPSAGVTYQWFYNDQPAPDTNFQEITGDFGNLTFPLGVTGASLEVNGFTTAENGWRFLVVATLGSTSVQSNPATVVVNASQSVVTTGPGAVQNVSVCRNVVNSSTFTVSSTGGTGFQWQYFNGVSWNNVVNGTPAGATYSNATTATLTVASAASAMANGAYDYRCLVAGPSGCPAIPSNTATLTVSSPAISASASVPTICGSGTSVLTASGAGESGTYLWTTNATLLAPLNVASVSAVPTATTTYTVTGTDVNGCSSTATVTVTVAPAITATATATPSVVCSGADSQLSAAYTPVASAAPTSYAFSGSSGTYTPLTGGTATTAIGDDVTQFPLPIGFNFTYNGTVFTDFGVTTNGHIRLGAGAAGLTNALATNSNILAPMWDDNHSSAGNITYKVDGAPGSQVLTVQWANTSIGGGGATGNSVSNYQVQLFEGTNVVRFNYGTLSSANGISASIGITGASGNFLSVTPGSPASASTVSSVTANNNITSVANIPSGTSYTFTPPVLPTITYAWTPTTFLSDPTIANPIATAVTAETTYTVTVTSSTGCSGTAIANVGIAAGILITSQPQDATFCQGTTATLSIGATGAGLIYQWRRNGVDLFGEINSSITIPNAQAANAGTYDVVINDICGGAPVTSSAATLTIVNSPTVDALTAQTSCANVATTAIPLTGTPAGVTFNISGGAAIGLANVTGVTAVPSFTGIAGSATITVTPSITSGATTCTGTPTTYVHTVNAAPAAPTAGSNSPVCDGIGNINLTASTVSVPGYSMNSNSGVAFIDIATTGTSVGTVADDSEHNITIPSFTFNGVAYTTARVGMNGLIALGSSTGDASATNAALPTTSNSAGNIFLAPFWDDLDIQTGASVRTQTVGNVHIIQYTTTAHDVFTTGSITFQVQLNLTTGAINFVYPDVVFGSATFDAGATATVGIQMSSTSAVQYSFNTASLTNNQSITFTPNSAAYSWTGPNGFASAVQNPSLPATALAAGTYTVVTVNAATGCQSAPATTNVVVNTPTTWYADADGDTFGNLAVSQLACTQPVGYVANSTDCDDTNNAIWQFATFFVDADADGYDNGSASVCSGVGAPAGYSATTLGSDCNDANNLVWQSNTLYTDADGDTFTVGTGTVTCYGATLPAGTTLTQNGNDCNDANNLVWQSNNLYIDGDGDGWALDNSTEPICYGATVPAGYVLVSLGVDCDDTDPLLTNNCGAGSVVNLTMFIEGYYLGGSLMNSVRNNQDGVSPLDEVELMTIELHDATSPHALVESVTGMLKTDGSLTCTFTTAPAGSYYIAVKGVNILQTWTATPQAVGAAPLNYDFSSAGTQAFGDMREMEPGVFAFYNGDVNQDDAIDNSDLDPILPDIETSNFGVLATDLNGDGAVDNSDLDNILISIDQSRFANYPL